MHNQKRLLHESPPLQFDDALASELQQEMNKVANTFDPAVPTTTALGGIAAGYRANCAKSIYKHEDASLGKDIKTLSKAAVDYWYSGNTVYDYATGDRTKYDQDSTKLYANFARMLWKASSKVAFGMIDQTDEERVWVVAYYCYDKAAVPGVTAGATSYETVKDNVGRVCVTDGYNDCYNERALARHNERREGHAGYSPLELDPAIAKAIQAIISRADF